jgi:hypothetical protein
MAATAPDYRVGNLLAGTGFSHKLTDHCTEDNNQRQVPHDTANTQLDRGDNLI